MILFEKINNLVMKWLAERLVPFLQNAPYLYGQQAIIIGKNVSLANVILNARSGAIKIGDDVIFGHNCMVLTGYHDIKSGGKRVTVENAGRDVVIGDNVWIASGVIIVGPVVIGNNSVIAAGSVVTRDIPPSVLAAGVPAKMIKTLPEQSEVN